MGELRLEIGFEGVVIRGNSVDKKNELLLNSCESRP